MKRWSVIIGIVIVVAAAATVFVVQQYSPSTSNVAVQAQASDGQYTGCGSTECSNTGEASSTGGCGAVAGVSGGCGGPDPNSVEARQRAESIRDFIYGYYAKKFNDPNLVVQINDYGCHMEADVLQDGKIVKRLSISGNSVTEIG